MTAPSPDATPAAPGFDRAYADEQIRRREHPLRRRIKRFYLDNLLADVRGPTIDFGCGAGQLLERLPSGSIGLELNAHLIAFLRARGLRVEPSLGCDEDFDLAGLSPGRFQTLVIAHVLEHLPNPPEIVARLLGACTRLGIERVVIVVPGAAGFAADRTHRTFIDAAYWMRTFGASVGGYQLRAIRQFPLPFAWTGRWFSYQETKIVLDRLPRAGTPSSGAPGTTRTR